jgi:predicted DNA-binding protein
MEEYVIRLTEELDQELEKRANAQGVSKEQYLNNLAKLFLSASHSIKREEFEKGYEEMGAINLQLADIGDCCDGKTEHNKRLNIFRRPKSRGGK